MESVKRLYCNNQKYLFVLISESCIIYLVGSLSYGATL